ncbi:unnamed protein product [marine sediment metagenome]|uniref:Uncharacterized protein n=1 Tax=marine sediment metagenome TaxID=412755 RepID=X0XER0_9ZZZZ
MSETNFYCPKCNKTFQSEGYDNPVFLADKVADCPCCGSKSGKESQTNNSVETVERRKKNLADGGEDWDVSW